MKTRGIAKDIRDSLAHQPAYLNQQLERIRIVDAKAKRDGRLMVKVIQNARVAWLVVRPDQSVSIFTATPMEELLTVAV
jgi:hypothetical protein